MAGEHQDVKLLLAQVEDIGSSVLKQKSTGVENFQRIECLTADSALEWRAGGLPSLLSVHQRRKVTVIGVPYCEGFRPRAVQAAQPELINQSSVVSLLKRRFVLV